MSSATPVSRGARAAMSLRNASLLSWLPVTAARKGSRASVRSRTGWSAVTVAVRGTSSISASSPKTSPEPSSRIVRPSRLTSTRPAAIT